MGDDKSKWTTYRWDCTSPNIFSSTFSNAANVASTVSLTPRKAITVGPGNALIPETFTGSIMPILIDNTSFRTETFYINSIADGGTSLIEGPYTITIACDDSIIIKEDPTF